MKKYTKTSPEYISNGHYIIGGKEFMNIWIFKNAYRLSGNKTWINAAEGENFVKNGVSYINTKPDSGTYDNILAYSINDLKSYYFKN